MRPTRGVIVEDPDAEPTLKHPGGYASFLLNDGNIYPMPGTGKCVLELGRAGDRVPTYSRLDAGGGFVRDSAMSVRDLAVLFEDYLEPPEPVRQGPSPYAKPDGGLDFAAMAAARKAAKAASAPAPPVQAPVQAEPAQAPSAQAGPAGRDDPMADEIWLTGVHPAFMRTDPTGKLARVDIPDTASLPRTETGDRRRYGVLTVGRECLRARPDGLYDVYAGKSDETLRNYTIRAAGPDGESREDKAYPVTTKYLLDTYTRRRAKFLYDTLSQDRMAAENKSAAAAKYDPQRRLAAIDAKGTWETLGVVPDVLGHISKGVARRLGYLEGDDTGAKSVERIMKSAAGTGMISFSYLQGEAAAAKGRAGEHVFHAAARVLHDERMAEFPQQGAMPVEYYPSKDDPDREAAWKFIRAMADAGISAKLTDKGKAEAEARDSRKRGAMELLKAKGPAEPGGSPDGPEIGG